MKGIIMVNLTLTQKRKWQNYGCKHIHGLNYLKTPLTLDESWHVTTSWKQNGLNVIWPQIVLSLSRTALVLPSISNALNVMWTKLTMFGPVIMMKLCLSEANWKYYTLLLSADINIVSFTLIYSVAELAVLS